MSLTKVTSKQLTHKQAGTGAVTRSVYDKFGESVSVKDFGAVGDGVADDTAAFASAFASGKAVYAPSGTYLTNIQTMPSNSYLFGDGASTIIKPLTPEARCALGAESGGPDAYIENITIRDVKFLGSVVTSGFSEQKHLTSFNGVKNLTIESCQFVGFRGDGIYLGSGNSGSTEMHNVNVTVRNCVFDGVNKDNRNGISVIDGDMIYILNNAFLNCSRADMPGAITIEPDRKTYNVAKNITITENSINGCGGASGSIGIYMPLAYGVGSVTTPPKNIQIRNNDIGDGTNNSIFVRFTNAVTPVLLTPSVDSHDIEISGNKIKGGNLVVIGVRGVSIRNNNIQAGIVFVGSNDSTNKDNCIEVDVAHNTVRDSPSVTIL